MSKLPYLNESLAKLYNVTLFTAPVHESPFADMSYDVKSNSYKHPLNDLRTGLYDIVLRINGKPVKNQSLILQYGCGYFLSLKIM